MTLSNNVVPPIDPFGDMALTAGNAALSRGQVVAAPPGGVPSLARLAYSRLGFGPRPGDPDFNDAISLNAYIDQQLAIESIDDSACDTAIAALSRQEIIWDVTITPVAVPTLDATVEQLRNYDDSSKARRVYAPEQLWKYLGRVTYARAALSKRQLYEVMVDFWGNHFNVDFRGQWLRYWEDANVIRPNALSNFRDLLGASARGPAMLEYLSNASNDGANPNENYAREVMELHTMGSINRNAGDPRLGLPNYSELDVHTLARVFSGWTTYRTQNGEFGFNDSNNWPTHDYTAKELWLGNDAKFFIPIGGEEQADMAMDILSDQPSTAWFVSRKLCRRFIADNPDGFCPVVIADGAAAFIANHGDIRATLGAILKANHPGADFKSSWGQKVKRPFEFYISAIRALGGGFPPPYTGTDVEDWELRDKHANTGQSLFEAAPPTGYPDFMPAWMNSNQVFSRWNLANVLVRRYFGEQDPSGTLAAVTNTALDVLIGASAATMSATQVVDRMTIQFYGRSMDPLDRTALISYLSTGGPSANVSSSNNTRLRPFLGVMLAAPYFQWR